MSGSNVHLLRAALRVFDAIGLGATTAEVAQAAHLSNGTLFRYFPTKQALQHGLFLGIDRDLYVAALTATMTPVTLEERLRRCWRQAAEQALADPAAFRYWAHYRQGATPASVAELPGWVLQVARWLDEAGCPVAAPSLPRRCRSPWWWPSLPGCGRRRCGSCSTTLRCPTSERPGWSRVSPAGGTPTVGEQRGHLLFSPMGSHAFSAPFL